MTLSAMSPARIIEIGDLAAGIAVPEGNRVRFFSAQPPFDPLDQRIYANLGQVNAAARACLRRPKRTPAREEGAPPIGPGGCARPPRSGPAPLAPGAA